MSYFDFFVRFYVNHVYGPTYILTELIACLSVSLVFTPVDIRKRKDLLRFFVDYLLTWIVECFFLSCLSYFLFEVTGHEEASQYMRLFIWPLLAFLHAAVLFRKKLFPQLLTCAIGVSSLVVLAISFSGSLGSLITDMVGTPKNLISDWTLYLVLFGLVALTILFKVFSPFRYPFLNQTSVILVNVVFLVTFALAVCASVLKIDGTIAFLISLTLLLLDMLVYVLFYLLVSSYNALMDSHAQIIKAEAERDQAALFAYQYDELHRLRHDFKNRLGVLSGLFKEGKYEEMANYFQSFSGEIHLATDTIDCGNALVNTIINMEIAKAASRNIPIKTHISVSRDLPFSSQDLSSLLTNALDNAIEAESRHDLKDEIDVTLFQEGLCLFYTVKNHTGKEDDGKPLLASRKEDKRNHGYGTRILRSICKKYQGTCLFHKEGDMFVFEAMLQMEERK